MCSPGNFQGTEGGTLMRDLRSLRGSLGVTFEDRDWIIVPPCSSLLRTVSIWGTL